ncbi:hypothetical protein ROHU_025100 [Labeo rohita]|uniref:Uncharacterized protein n=1 Tax=Labeo rohita TaxID=84645 RepID=A0A498MGM5_LABRO|nr:hypothetical protein ROHU_025100 [Labeo rohita]
MRRCKGLRLVQEENRPVMHQTTGMAKQPGFLTKDTALFSRPSRGRNGSHVSASLSIQISPSFSGRNYRVLCWEPSLQCSHCGDIMRKEFLQHHFKEPSIILDFTWHSAKLTEIPKKLQVEREGDLPVKCSFDVPSILMSS